MASRRLGWVSFCAGSQYIWYDSRFDLVQERFDSNDVQIEDYPPRNTIVVVPEKMQKYYADTKVPTDTYPWQG